MELRHVFAAHGHYVGIIDWGDATAGDPLFDLARFSMEETGAMRQLLIGYGLARESQHERTFAAYRIIRNVSALLYEHLAGGDWFDAYRSRITADLNSLRC